MSFVRAGRWFCWFGAELLCDTDGNVPVGRETEHRGGEHGECVHQGVKSSQLQINSSKSQVNGFQMTSVERVVEYTELESEAPWETKKRPPPDWPSKGMVTFDRVNFSYTNDGPLVLQNLKAMFRPQEKVGIVGRTGAGKSSLISALFRLAEPQGKIYIDGVLTSEIGLHDLRQKMSIIPQVNWCFDDFYYKSL